MSWLAIRMLAGCRRHIPAILAAPRRKLKNGSTLWSKRHSFEGVNESDHSDRFVARVFQCATPISETKLREALDHLPHGVLRLKGFVRLDSNPERVRLVQGVGTRWTISDADSDVEQEGCALVVIGAKELLSDEDFSRMRELFNQPQS